MKKTLSILSVVALSAICSNNVNAQELEKFKADMGKKAVMGKEVRVPYTDVISYYGYVKPGSKPDEEKGGKKYYYLYVWIPAVAPEIGIRMISPVPAKMAPEKTDFQAADYEANKADTKNFFDTWISFEKAEGVTSAADIATKGKTAKWNQIDSNDDSGEMPAQPSGSKYNSMMRITSEVNNPLKALTVGLYRIGFTTYKTGEVQGSFAAQLGSPVKLPGTKVAPTLDLLAAPTK
ncbi:MAG: LipL32 family surface lipoprotein [Bacteroidota bacterium]